jgi:excisionase family DNA binding protein
MIKIDIKSAGEAGTAGASRSSVRLSYSVTEAAELTGLGRTTLYALMKQGALASCKVGKRRIIRRADLEQLISSKHDGAA